MDSHTDRQHCHASSRLTKRVIDGETYFKINHSTVAIGTCAVTRRLCQPVIWHGTLYCLEFHVSGSFWDTGSGVIVRSLDRHESRGRLFRSVPMW